MKICKKILSFWKFVRKFWKYIKNFNKILKKLTKIYIFFCYRGLLLAEAWSGFWWIINFKIFRVLGERSPCLPWLRPCSAVSYFYLGGLSPKAIMTRRHCAHFIALSMSFHYRFLFFNEKLQFLTIHWKSFVTLQFCLSTLV